jgi:hypothetical protein
MAKKIIKSGSTTHRSTCDECGAVFTYEREDVCINYVRGGEWVSCPSCCNQILHGAGNMPRRGGTYGCRAPSDKT